MNLGHIRGISAIAVKNDLKCADSVQKMLSESQYVGLLLKQNSILKHIRYILI